MWLSKFRYQLSFFSRLRYQFHCQGLSAIAKLFLTNCHDLHRSTFNAEQVAPWCEPFRAIKGRQNPEVVCKYIYTIRHLDRNQVFSPDRSTTFRWHSTVNLGTHIIVVFSTCLSFLRHFSIASFQKSLLVWCEVSVYNIIVASDLVNSFANHLSQIRHSVRLLFSQQHPDLGSTCLRRVIREQASRRPYFYLSIVPDLNRCFTAGYIS